MNLILQILGELGPSTHYEIHDEHSQRAAKPLPAKQLRFAVAALAAAGHIEPHPIAGRGRRGRKARRWRLAHATSNDERENAEASRSPQPRTVAPAATELARRTRDDVETPTVPHQIEPEEDRR